MPQVARRIADATTPAEGVLNPSMSNLRGLGFTAPHDRKNRIWTP